MLETVFWYVAPALVLLITMAKAWRPRIRSADRYRARKILGFTIRTKGFPLNPSNVVSVSGPHPFLPWRKIYYYERSRRRS